ncbi:uncharacterized protein LOC121645500 [Melanotaenia boesemani]|uniref:uncharacterized protein LOC121645500 n=1 Tax=Melanotaenia boesemani TaxID=1250792 RepID=UPI001C043CDE|nr:uncharacterized protein LOC121645500 [Melanotaenia boesemani]
MASNYRAKTPRVFQKARVLLCFLLLLDLTSTSPLKGSDHQNFFEGEVGGNVTLHCPVDKNKNVTFMYLQRLNIPTKEVHFVNGYHISKTLTFFWENSRLNRNNSSVLISNLNVSHIGTYECAIRYNDEDVIKTFLQLNVTAPYKKPIVTNSCKEENGVSGCHVTCTFHDGFPENRIQWDKEPVNGSAKTHITEGSTEEDPITKLFNISSTAYINCSGGERMVSCSVGGVTLNTSLVCPSKVIPFTPYVVVAVIVIVPVLVLVVVYLMCRKRKPVEPPEYIATANMEEGVRLTECRKETEAS